MPGRAGRATPASTLTRAALTAVLATVLLVGLVGVLAACGSDAPPDQTVRESYGKLAAEDTARLGTEAATQVGSQPITVPGDGEVDFTKHGYAVGLSLPGLGPIQAVGLGPVSYLQSAQLTASLPPGTKPWLLLDPDRLRAAGPGGEDLAQTTDNPLGQAALVTGAGPDTRPVGQDTIDGDQTTHYASTIDVGRAHRGAGDPDTTRAVDEYAQKIGSPTVPADVWVDDDGRLRKLTLSLSAPGSSPATATLTFSALGSPAPTVVAPPPDQVTDIAALLTRPPAAPATPSGAPAAPSAPSGAPAPPTTQQAPGAPGG